MTSRRDKTAAGAGQPRTVIVFIWAFLGVGTMICAWSIATPIGAAPDEPAHIAQAVAIVRGQFNEPNHPSPFGPLARVRVPGWAAENHGIPCFVWADEFTHPVQTGIAAACADTLSNATRPTTFAVQFSNSPPLYYVVAGIPSLFLSGASALYAMRLMSDLLNAGLVALGISLLIRYYPRRTPLVGVLIALSPMVLFLMAVVTSSGLEISSGFATWCGAMCIVEHPRLPRALAVWTAVAAVVLVLNRPTSPLDAGIITVVLALLIGWRGLRQRLNPSLVPLWVPVLVAVIVAGGFLIVVGPPPVLGVAPLHRASLLSNMWTTLRLSGDRLRQCIGDFGWLDTPVPTWVVIVWTSSVAALTALALTLSAQCRRALPVLALLILAMPLALESPTINRLSVWWQGRLWLPVVVGFPLVASTFHWPSRPLWDRRTDRHWVAPAVVLGVGLVLFAAQVASFTHALRRYEVGLGVQAGAPTIWLPPGGHDPVVVAFVVGAVVTLALVVFMTLPRMKVAPVGAPELGGSGHVHQPLMADRI
jgi:Predicted membrane protein (DUF2142)